MDKYENRRLRLALAIETRCGGKQSELARKAGISESYVARMLYKEGRAGRKRIGEDLRDRIAAALDLDPSWFDEPYYGEAGEAGESGLVPGGPSTADVADVPPPKGLIRAIHPDDPADPEIIFVPESRIEFSAGNGKVHYELVEEEEPATYRLSWFQKNQLNPERVRRFRVAGDSQEPMLYDGDIVLVNLDETNIIDGRLYAIRYGDELRVKYLSRRLDGTLVLRSINPAYKDEEVSPQTADEHISIIGRVRDKSGKGGL